MDPQSRFQEFVRQHHGRLTPQREFIVKEFLALSGHYSIQDLHDHFRQKGKRINPSTIFRTLKLLVQAGIAAERQFGNGSTIYEINVAHHDHMICLACGKIVEFDNPQLESLQGRIIRKMGFTMAYHKHEIYGYCRLCAKKSKGTSQ
jgi:Fur family transcriptional regulator, ferric uptake regulator